MISLDYERLQRNRVTQELNGIVPAIEAALQTGAETLRKLIIGGTPIDPKSSDHAKHAWSPLARSSTGFSFSNSAAYASVLDEGWYPATGPRTVAVGGRVYSRQAPRGMVDPILEGNAVEQMMNGILAQIRWGTS